MGQPTFTIKFEDFSYEEITLDQGVQLLIRARVRTTAANRLDYECCIGEMNSMIFWAFKKKPGAGVSRKLLEWIETELRERKRK